jgi:hypothetical protein
LPATALLPTFIAAPSLSGNLHTNSAPGKMQSKSILIAALLTLTIFNLENLSAQSPQLINYQAIARNNQTGIELVQQPIEVVFKILNGSSTGSIVYQEQHSTETNQFGLFNLQIGAGEVVSGDFSAINWGEQEKWLTVEIDLGSGLEEVSVSQLISVPYALHAQTATTAITADNVDDADADPTNELIEAGSFQLIDTLLIITEGGITHQVSIAALGADDDWQIGDNIVYNSNDKIGIGLDEPEHRLQVFNPGLSEADSVAVFAESENAAVNSYGIFARASGSSLENRAIFGDAPGLAGVNWAGYFNGGNVFVKNRLSLGPASPTAQFHLRGSASEPALPLALIEKSDETAALRVESDGKIAVGNDLPNSLFHVQGSVAAAVRHVSVADGLNFTLDETDFMFIAAVDGGNILLNLPPAASCPGRIYFIKRTFTNPTNNTLQIAPAIGETIDGTTFPMLLSSTSDREKRILVSAGANGWFVMSQ